MMNVTTTSISLSRMKFYAFHGALPLEQVVGGSYTVDLTLDLTPPLQAMQEDDLSDTVNYAEVYHLLRQEMQQPAQLLEHLAYRMAERLFASFSKVVSLQLRVTKDCPPMGGQMGGASFVLSASRSEA